MSIELKNVTYTYSPGTAYEIHALKDINLSIPDGQFIGIIGHTGSGKSTLIQHFNALIRPTSGTITYNGEDIWGEKYDRRALRSEVGLVFQYPEHQLFENDVLSDVCFGPMNQGLSREEAEVEAKKALQHVGFKEKNFSKSPFELSGGQKKRVAIAGVLAMNPKILILDEPTAGLDPKGRDDILDQIAELHKVRGITIILVSHSMEDIAKYADRVLVMSNKKIAMYDTVENVFARAPELLALGLSVPQVTKIFLKLREMGVKIGSTTGYTDAMMNIVAPKAAQQGYAPDFWISPDGVGGRGRPYPYMIFANMQALGLTAVGNVVKVGDTISDIKEGVNAGVWTAGVIEGSSELGLSQQEYEAMSPQERETACQKVEERFRRAGAHFVVRDLSQLPDLVHACGFKNMRR